LRKRVLKATINVFVLFKLLLNENNRLLNAAVSELVAFVEELLL
jgi:hypothetical protein